MYNGIKLCQEKKLKSGLNLKDKTNGFHDETLIIKREKNVLKKQAGNAQGGRQRAAPRDCL